MAQGDNNRAVQAISASAMNAIPTFSGEQTAPEAAVTFLDLVSALKETNGWTEAMALHVAQARLRGPAAAWFRNLEYVDNNGKPTVFAGNANSFENRFKTRFIPPKDIWAILKRNDKMQQKQDETIGVYLDRIYVCSTELAKAIFGANQDNNNAFRRAICTTAVLASFNGVLPEVKAKFHEIVQARARADALTWADFTDLMMEAGLVKHKAGSQMPAGYNAEQVASTQPPAGALAVVHDPQDQEEEGVAMAQELEFFQVAVVQAQAAQTVVCWHCRKRGHISRDCRSKNKPRTKWNNSNYSQTPRRQGPLNQFRNKNKGQQQFKNKTAAVTSSEEVNGSLSDMWSNMALDQGNE